MDKTRHDNIVILRKHHYSYREIAEAVGSNTEAVKKYCNRHGIAVDDAYSKKDTVTKFVTCQVCGRIIIQKRTGREKRYCSSYCRKKAWRKAQNR